MTVRLIDLPLLDELTARAQAAPRRRMNLNFHAEAEDPCQRLLNAIEPGSYIRPHRHLAPPKPELFIVVRGRLALLLFDADGAVEQVQVLSPEGSACGVEVPAGAWHTVLALTSGTVFCEVKPGPYRPFTEADFAPWAPADNAPAAPEYQQRLAALAAAAEREG